MVVLLKAGVTLDPIAPAGFCILSALKATARELGVPLTITSGTDGVHSGPDDPHKKGEAYDIRSHDLSPDTVAKVLACLRSTLGSDFFAFLESPQTLNEHIHCQRAKGTTFDVVTWLQT